MDAADQDILASAKNNARFGERFAKLAEKAITLKLLVEEGNQLHQEGTLLLNLPSNLLNQLAVSWPLGRLMRGPPMLSALSTPPRRATTLVPRPPLQHLQPELLIITFSLTLPQNTGG